MARSVVYADLKFATALPLTAPTCPAAPDEDDSLYENVPLGPVPTVPSPGRWSHRWRIPMGLQAAGLLLPLLLVVATVSLGACYWQVTRSLQDASREHAAEQGRLSQEVSAQEQELEQTRLELVWARAELQRAWQEVNSSQQELAVLQKEMQKMQEEMQEVQKEMQEVQEDLRASKRTVSSLHACVNTDCCPSGWVLYRGRCLFISMEKKNWGQSRDDCREKSAQLLVQGNWTSLMVPDFVEEYWIGAVFASDMKNTYIWQDSKQSYLNSPSTYCGLSAKGKILRSKCWTRHQWICEQPPKLSTASETFRPFSVKD